MKQEKYNNIFCTYVSLCQYETYIILITEIIFYFICLQLYSPINSTVWEMVNGMFVGNRGSIKLRQGSLNVNECVSG